MLLAAPLQTIEGYDKMLRSQALLDCVAVRAL